MAIFKNCFNLSVLIFIYISNINCENHLYPFGLAAGDTKLNPGDDGGSKEIKLASYFHIFNYPTTSLYVNVNGVISFSKKVPLYPSEKSPNIDTRFVAPFWADIDTRRSKNGSIYYRQTTDTALANKLTETIHKAYPNFVKFFASWMFIATWDRVLCFGSQNDSQTNTFQAILTNNAVHSFALFNYGTLNWDAGMVSDEVKAKVGYSVNATHNYFITESGTNEILEALGQNKTLLFHIFGTYDDDGCKPKGSLIVSPHSGTMLGGSEIVLSGLCLDSNVKTIKCDFNFVKFSGSIINEMKAKCHSLHSKFAGAKALGLLYNNDNSLSYKGTFIAISPEDVIPEITRENTHLWNDILKLGPYKISWNATLIDTLKVDVDLFMYSKIGENMSTKIISVYKNVLNNGSLMFIPQIDTSEFTGSEVGVLRITASGNKENGVRMLWSDIHLTHWYTLNYVHWKAYEIAQLLLLKLTEETSPQNIESENHSIKEWIDRELQNTMIEIVNNVPDSIKNNSTSFKETIFKEVKLFWIAQSPSFYEDLCLSLNNQVVDIQDLPPCPCTLEEAIEDDGRFEPDTLCNKDRNTILNCPFNPGAYHCVKTILTREFGPAQQCCYSQSGILLIYPNKGRGRFQKWHSRSQNKIDVIPVVSNYLEDLYLYSACCIFSQVHCDYYFAQHRSDTCKNYEPPDITMIWGDPHLITFDGLQYTFNAIGEFWLIKSEQGFKLQGRASTGLRENGTSSWQALAMREALDHTVQVEINNKNAIDVLVDGEKLDLDEIPYYQFKDIVFKMKSNLHLHIIMNNGVSAEVFKIDDHLDTKFKIPFSFKGKTKGLLGTWNNNPDDDFQTPEGKNISINASLIDLHYDFGLKWRIIPQESLFSYKAGTNHFTYQDMDFHPVFNLPQLKPRISQICGSDSLCLFDYAMTGDEKVANGTRDIIENFKLSKKRLQGSNSQM